jgi:hypothetical protein
MPPRNTDLNPLQHRSLGDIVIARIDCTDSLLLKVSVSLVERHLTYLPLASAFVLLLQQPKAHVLRHLRRCYYHQSATVWPSQRACCVLPEWVKEPDDSLPLVP